MCVGRCMRVCVHACVHACVCVIITVLCLSVCLLLYTHSFLLIINLIYIAEYNTNGILTVLLILLSLPLLTFFFIISLYQFTSAHFIWIFSGSFVFKLLDSLFLYSCV